MLLNLSNHPSAAWPPAQLDQATKDYVRITDMPFPVILPEWDTAEVQRLADAYAADIAAMAPAPTAVHIMGEMTFTCALVGLLRLQGIPCVASTTKRDAIERDGIKTSTFHFVRFRAYP
jgi:hypothetical protein